MYFDEMVAIVESLDKVNRVVRKSILASSYSDDVIAIEVKK